MSKIVIRMLVDQPIDGKMYKSNQLVEVDDGVAKSLKDVTDTSKEGVEWCKSQGIKVVKHEKPQPPKPDEE